MKNFCIILATTLIVACASTKTNYGNKSTIIEYKVTTSRVFADSIWAGLKKQTPGMALQSKIENLKSSEKPNPVFYSLHIKDSLSQLSYIEPLVIDKNSRLVRSVTPFTKSNSYKFIDSTAVYVDLENMLPGVWMKKENLDFEWEKGKKDSIILGMNAHLMIGKKENTKIKAWVTSEYPKTLSIYDVYTDAGFVLSYELHIYSEPPFKSQKLSVVPIKLKKNAKKDFVVPKLGQLMSEQEIINYNRKMRAGKK